MIPGETPASEKITPWGVLSYYSLENTVPTLVALKDNPVRHKTKLTDDLDKHIDPSTVSEIVANQRDRGLVRFREDRKQYEITQLGNLSLQVYNDLLTTVGVKAVNLIAKSRSIVSMLDYLDSTSASLSDLANSGSIDASRSTISNNLSNLEEIGWVDRKPPYETSTTGSSILAAYEEFADYISCLAERQQFLQYFDMGGLTLDSLRGTEMVAATEGDTDAPTQAFVDAVQDDFDQVLGVTPTITKQYVQAFLPLIRSDCQVELVGDRSVLEEANSTYVSAFATGMVSPTTTFLVSDDPITVGIAILDRETVWLGAYGWSRRERAVLTGTNEALLRWALDAYEAISEEASTPSETAVSSLKEVL